MTAKRWADVPEAVRGFVISRLRTEALDLERERQGVIGSGYSHASVVAEEISRKREAVLLAVEALIFLGEGAPREVVDAITSLLPEGAPSVDPPALGTELEMPETSEVVEAVVVDGPPGPLESIVLDPRRPFESGETVRVRASGLQVVVVKGQEGPSQVVQTTRGFFRVSALERIR